MNKTNLSAYMAMTVSQLKEEQITNFNTYPEASRSSEIPEFIKNSQQQASAR